MKTTILIKEDRVQLVLEYETDHEKEVLKVLEKLPNTHRADFIDCRTGYTWDRGHDKDLVIVFDQKEEKEFEGIDINEQVQKARENKTTYILYRGDGHGNVIGDPIVSYDFRELQNQEVINNE